MSETPPVPDCPPWCTKPAAHGFISYPIPGVLDLDRDNVAFRVDIVRADNKPLTVSVYAHESCSADEGLYRSPAMLFIDGTEGLVLGDLLKLNAVLREAEAVFTRITRGRARAVLREGPAAARVVSRAGETEYTSYLPDTGVNLVELASPMVRINDDLSLHLSQTEEWFCEDITHTRFG